MTHRGKVKNGVVVLDDPKALPDGTDVIVEPVKSKSKPTRKAKQLKKYRQRLMKYAGKADGLPSDASRNLEHYLYGHPKR